MFVTDFGESKNSRVAEDLLLIPMYRVDDADFSPLLLLRGKDRKQRLA